MLITKRKTTLRITLLLNTELVTKNVKASFNTF